MNFYFFIYLVIFIVGLLSLSFNRKHIFLCLLSLEYILLSLLVLLYLYLIIYEYEYYYGIIFLSFGVCEGALSLSILVSLIRSHGNDYLKSFRILC